MYYIYEMRHTPTGRVYVGQRKLPKGKTPETDTYYGSGKIWKRIYKQHPEECVKTILEVVKTKKEVDELEEKFIASYRELYGDKCVNVADGGGGCKGYKHTQETKELLRELAKGNTRCKGRVVSEKTREKMRKAREGYKFPEEFHKKMSEIVSGEGNPMFGKHHSEATRKKISEAKKGKHLSEEHRKKISEGGKGRHQSEATRKKISEANSGEKHYNYGKHLSEGHRKKISEALSGDKNPNFGKRQSLERDEFGRFKKKGTQP